MRNEFQCSLQVVDSALTAIVSLLGAGGMGEVYRARDSAFRARCGCQSVARGLSRAIPSASRAFSVKRKSWRRSIIPTLRTSTGYTSPAAVRALVMELRRRPHARGSNCRWTQCHSIESLTIATQIATALEVAHDQGIVHRDLKPANVKIGSGTVKVLDFGLAKALANDGEGGASSVSNSPTLTARSTQLGMILGTAAYMAPEQAQGRSVDRRADVWAFGVVFFEMLGPARLRGRRRIGCARVGPQVGTGLERAALGMFRRRCDESSGAVWKKIRRSACATSAMPGSSSKLHALGQAISTRSQCSDGDHGGCGPPPRWVCYRSSWRSRSGGAEPATALPNPLANATFTRLTDFEGTEHGGRGVARWQVRRFHIGSRWPGGSWVTQVGSSQYANTAGQGRRVGRGANGPIFSRRFGDLAWRPAAQPATEVHSTFGWDSATVSGRNCRRAQLVCGRYASRLSHQGEPGNPVRGGTHSMREPKQIYIHPRPDGRGYAIPSGLRTGAGSTSSPAIGPPLKWTCGG